MKTYVIRCKGEGQQLFAQKLLFSKGFNWRTRKGQVRTYNHPVMIFIRDGFLTFREDDDLTPEFLSDPEENYQVITFSELLRL